MYTKKAIFYGIATALITPFCRDETDMDAFRRLISFQIEEGVHALVVCGTTGEASTLTEKERDTLLYAALEESQGRVPVIMGTGTNDTAKTVHFSKRARELGASGILVVTPYYNKGTREGMQTHFLQAAETGLPTILYNVPSRTGVDLSIEDYVRLASHPMICGVKEASDNIEKFALLCHTLGERLAVYTGNDSHLLPALAAGGDGVISVASNILPRDFVSIFGKWEKEMGKSATKEWQKLLPFIRLLFCETNPAPIKYAMAACGFGDGGLRLPLSPVTQENAELLFKEMKDLRLL